MKSIVYKNENGFVDKLKRMYERKKNKMFSYLKSKSMSMSNIINNDNSSRFDDNNMTIESSMCSSMRKTNIKIPPLFRNMKMNNTSLHSMHKLALSPSGSSSLIMFPQSNTSSLKKNASMPTLLKHTNFTMNFLKYIDLVLKKHNDKSTKRGKQTTIPRTIYACSFRSSNTIDNKIASLYSTFPYKIKKQLEKMKSLNIHIKFLMKAKLDILRQIDICDTRNQPIENDDFTSSLFTSMADFIDQNHEHDDFVVNQEIDPSRFFKPNIQFNEMEKPKEFFKYSDRDNKMKIKHEMITRLLKESMKKEKMQRKILRKINNITLLQHWNDKVNNEAQTDNCNMNNESHIIAGTKSSNNDDVNDTDILFKELTKEKKVEEKKIPEENKVNWSLYSSVKNSVVNSEEKNKKKKKKKTSAKKKKKEEPKVETKKEMPSTKKEEIPVQKEEEEIPKQEKIEIKVNLEKQLESKHSILQKLDSVEKKPEEKKEELTEEQLQELRKKYTERERRIKRISKDKIIDPKILDIKEENFNINDFFFPKGTDEQQKQKELKVLKLTQELNYLLSQEPQNGDQTLFEEFKEKINSLKKFDRETYLSYLNDNYDYIQEELNTLKRLKKNERDINDFMYHFVSDQKQTKQLRYLHVPDIKLVTFEEEIEYIISENSVDRKSNMKDY